jgi:DNA-binding beta-propeller fold protein YncE
MKFTTSLPHCLFVFCLLIGNPPAWSQWRIRTIAGTGEAGFNGDGPTLETQLNNPFGVVRGPDGAIWFCEYDGQRIRRINALGQVETIAGNGQTGYSGDGGPAEHATFNQPHEIRFDAAGNLYIVDMRNHAIRKVDMQTYTVTTIAGTGKPGYAGDDGPAEAAQLNMPHSIQFGPDGSLYICDIGNHVIRRIDLQSGTITTFAGTGKPGATPAGAPILGTPLNGPRSLDFDQAGNLWLATREGNQVFKFDMQARIIHHVAGTGAKGFTGNGGPAKQATLSGPKGIAIDGQGNVWLADTESFSLRMIDARTGNLELMAGTGEKGDGPESDPLQCKLARLHGVYADKDGSILIGDSEAHRVRVLEKVSTERIVLVAGGETEATEIPASTSRLYEPFGVAFDHSGAMWIVEMSQGNRLLKIDAQGILHHVAGQRKSGFSGDGGSAVSAQFNGPHNLAIQVDGQVLVADTWNGRIRQVDPVSGKISSLPGFAVPVAGAKGAGPYCITLDFTGTKLHVADLRQVHEIDLTTGKSRVVAGNGSQGIPLDDTLATEAPLVDPRAAAADRLGNLYILERGGHALRVVNSEGKLRTVVNAAGQKGNSGDGGPAREATMNGPKHLCIDRENRVLIADAENNLIRRYDPGTGMIERIAGTGKQGPQGVGGAPRECQLARPHGVTVHPETGELYITDSYNNRVLKITTSEVE